MLDSTTKRRIDTARDILVGKVPDPKSQVEQITIALIYKFMDDMDAEAEEFGGRRSFFAGAYALYGWAKLMHSGLGGHETLALYAEAITKMTENTALPALFRDIFKNAYLPYRDPETLRAFLKIIDGFSYDHSEKLGDAFEYLLSVLGSQGDAGQFRTPRHIIDFMVELIDPRKDETVLDPACGTAGFLISSYKHILRQNTDKKGHSRLTPDDRARIARNFKGYDISPDMVRLSLVNLYLHGFTDPHVFEYDTLTSQDRWNEFADVILANPPFMSPKGGIKPHKRFSIQAKRSEVLFVDYMAEHLTPKGRAAIIVPEGIIFQSQTAYKELRKMLVENSLVAVISLPAGCFNPYSGVKTSILILDKTLAKQADTIAFFKVENDGFGLGAQRRAIDKNDLPQVKQELEIYLNGLRSGSIRANGTPDPRAAGTPDPRAKGPAHTSPGQRPGNAATTDDEGLKARSKHASADGPGLQPSNPVVGSGPGAMPQAGMECAVGAQFTTGLIVPKEKLAANGDYNLSGERYRENGVHNHSHPLVSLGDEVLFQVESGGTPKSNVEEYWNGGIPWATLVDLPATDFVTKMIGTQRTISAKGLKESSAKMIPTNSVVVSTRATIGRIAINRVPLATNQGFKNVIIKDGNRVVPEFVAFALTKLVSTMKAWATGGTFAEISKSKFCELQIPLPPLSVQQEIVAEIEGYQKVIDGARAVLDHYRPHIPIHPEWPMVELREVCDNFQYGSSLKSSDNGEVVCLRMGNIQNGEIDWSDLKFAPPDEDFEKYLLSPNDVLFNRTNSPIHVGKTGIYRGGRRAVFAGYLIRIGYQKDKLMGQYLNYCLNTDEAKEFCLRVKTDGINQSNINAKILGSFEIPLPPLATQQAIVEEIEAEQALVAANRELIARFEKKIQATLARVWGEEETAP